MLRVKEDFKGKRTVCDEEEKCSCGEREKKFIHNAELFLRRENSA